MPQRTTSGSTQQRRGGRGFVTHNSSANARNMTAYIGSNFVCATIFFILAGVVLFKSRSDYDPSLRQRSRRSKYSGDQKSLESESVVQRGLEGIDEDVLWQVPSADNALPRAILFLAHGCGHRATDWWPSDDIEESIDISVCPDCIGLPEEQAIVKIALDKNIVAVAMSAQSPSGCWSLDDAPGVAKALTKLQQNLQESSESLSTIPILAFGASSGGRFVTHYLPEALDPIPIDGRISQISASERLSPVPPKKAAAFLVMARDEKTKKTSLQAQQALQSKHYIPVFHQVLEPLPLTPDFFYKRVKGISLHFSKQLVQALKSEHLLNKEGFLLQDPNRSSWREIIKPLLDAQDTYHDNLIHDRSPLSEVLKVAWSQHELSRDGVDEAINFLLDPPLIDS